MRNVLTGSRTRWSRIDCIQISLELDVRDDFQNEDSMQETKIREMESEQTESDINTTQPIGVDDNENSELDIFGLLSVILLFILLIIGIIIIVLLFKVKKNGLSSSNTTTAVAAEKKEEYSGSPYGSVSSKHSRDGDYTVGQFDGDFESFRQ